MRKRPGKGIRGTDSGPAANVLQLRTKTSELPALHTNKVRLFQMVEAQHENRRAAMFVNEDCVDSRSDVDELSSTDQQHVNSCLCNAPFL